MCALPLKYYRLRNIVYDMKWTWFQCMSSLEKVHQRSPKHLHYISTLLSEYRTFVEFREPNLIIAIVTIIGIQWHLSKRVFHKESRYCKHWDLFQESDIFNSIIFKIKKVCCRAHFLTIYVWMCWYFFSMIVLYRSQPSNFSLSFMFYLQWYGI